jgi:Mg2+ and Co2+ transporter CorA
MIGTIFIPLTFIVGFFGMNFQSMGVPSLKKGIFTIKHAQHKLATIFFIIIFFTIMLYINFLKVF